MPGRATAFLDAAGHRFLLRENLEFGAQSDYTGGTQYRFIVELHVVASETLARVRQIAAIDYGPTTERSTTFAAMGLFALAIADDDPRVHQLGDHTRVASVEWPAERPYSGPSAYQSMPIAPARPAPAAPPRPAPLPASPGATAPAPLLDAAGLKLVWRSFALGAFAALGGCAAILHAIAIAMPNDRPLGVLAALALFGLAGLVWMVALWRARAATRLLHEGAIHRGQVTSIVEVRRRNGVHWNVLVRLEQGSEATFRFVDRNPAGQPVTVRVLGRRAALMLPGAQFLGALR
ncbi:hypothetical protein DB32_008561 [Sandaracinus amylolyticus]|uniref:Uncharacterized protein n=2 Tax=Sandaracinus amylolyticus TaxID=927083 RepID=A0A0F6WA88_9BACT|nr:hypothetical protein DB32_008561 [Sandaracinus amylolyticus]